MRGHPDPTGDPAAGDAPAFLVCVRTTCSDFGGKIDSGLGNPLAELRALIAETVAARHGRMVDSDARETVFGFASAAAAVECTQAVHRGIAACARPQWIGARIGCIDTTVRDERSTAWHQAVQFVRHLAERAAPGQTIASTRLVADLDPVLQKDLQALDACDWASDRTGIGIPLCVVTWQDDVQTRIANPVLKDNAITRVERLRLRWRGEHLELDQYSQGVTIGRSARADITIDSEYASRIHAELCTQDTCFVLRDSSTNGTYVKTDEAEVYLHDDKLILRGEGSISLGRRNSSAKGKVVFFTAEPAKMGDRQ